MVMIVRMAYEAAFLVFFRMDGVWDWGYRRLSCNKTILTARQVNPGKQDGLLCILVWVPSFY